MTGHIKFGWAIARLHCGHYGLFSPVPTRAEAIAIHTESYRKAIGMPKDLFKGAVRTKFWQRCKYRGDRAVKVIIIYEYPE